MSVAQAMTARSAQISNEQKLELYKKLLISRQGDIREQRLIRQGKGSFHVSGMGHEGIGAAGLLMNEGDYCFPYYRDRGLATVRGVEAKDMALSYYAKKDGSSGGRQLPGHFCSRERNVWSVLSPIAAHWLPAVGAAWGIQMDGKKNVVVTTLGDGGTRQGDFHEATTFARERKLPVVFVVEDNGYAISTPTSDMSVKAIGGLTEDWQHIDGTDIEEVYSTFHAAFEKARAGEGPSFIWARVERLSSHSSNDDQRSYRTEEDLENIQGRDPIELLAQDLMASGVLTKEANDKLIDETQEQLRAIYAEAEQAQEPPEGYEQHNILGAENVGLPPALKAGEEYRIADALTETFDNLLASDERVQFFGEDIESPLGGVFKLTRGLSEKYPGRVANAPLAEASILGIASGLASYGKRPVFEIQFVDFITPGWTQLFNNIAGLRWRSNGQWTCPAVIYAPCGAYLPGGGSWHSQSLEAAFAQMPGLRVVVPSTSEDAAGYFQTAMACDDPTLILLPKHLFWSRNKIPTSLHAIPFGRAAVRQRGADITVVTWGNPTELVHEVIQEIGNEVSIEFIDLRSIVPWDKATVLESVRKTGRLLVVHEDNERCGVGQMIISTVTSDADTWPHLHAAPALVARQNVNIAYNEHCEFNSLPSKQDIIDAIRKSVQSRVEHKSAPQHLASANTRTPFAQAQEAEVKEHSQITVSLPNLGEGLRDAKLVSMLKKVGDKIRPDDALCEVETDKAVFPVESSVEGTLSEWLVNDGDMVTVGQDLLRIATNGPAPTSQSAQETCPAAQAQQQAAPSETQLTHGDGALSPHIIQQLQGVLQAGLSVSVGWNALREFRAAARGRSKGGAFSYSTMVAWAMTRALEENPAFRRLLMNGKASSTLEDFDIGFAVALDDDVLETAVVPNANKLSWDDFVAAYREALSKAKKGEPQSKARTCAILTSMGPLKIRSGSPIVVPPALSTLFLGEPYMETQEVDGELKPMEVANLDLSFDHRWANGAGAGRFIRAVKDHIEGFKAE